MNTLIRKSLIITFLSVIILSLSAFYSVHSASEIDENLQADIIPPRSFSEALQDFPYLKVVAVDSLLGDTSGYLSTDSIDDLKAILALVSPRDICFFDFDEVLIKKEERTVKNTLSHEVLTKEEASEEKCILTHPEIRNIFFSTRRKAPTYILSAGNNPHCESQFLLRGTKISEPMKYENGAYINPILKELPGFQPYKYLAENPVRRKQKPTPCIVFCPGEFLTEPVLGIYLALGAFEVRSALWCQNNYWANIPDDKIEKMTNTTGLTMIERFTLKYLYAGAPVKGRIMSAILPYLEQTSEGGKPHDILLIDDNKLNCMAFTYYVIQLKSLGLYTGNVKVIHFTLVKPDKLTACILDTINNHAHEDMYSCQEVPLITLNLSIIL